MFSYFIPIDSIDRSNSPPPIKPIFTNKMHNGNGQVNGKRPRENDSQNDSQNDTKKIKN